MNPTAVRVPELIEIIKIVKQGKIEENEYKEAVKIMKNDYIPLIGKKGDGVMIEAKSKAIKVNGDVAKLEDRLVSGGEHLDYYIRINANNRVVFDIKNRKFTIFLKRKTQYVQLVNDHLQNLFQMAGIYLHKSNKVTSVRTYHEIVDVLKANDEINDYVVQNVNVVELDGGEELSQELVQPKSSTKERRKSECKKFKTGKQKRDMDEEADGEPVRKYGKIDVDEHTTRVRSEAELKAKREMIPLRKKAMKRFPVSERWRNRCLSDIRDLAKMDRLGERVKKLEAKLGGKAEIEENWKVQTDRLQKNVIENRQKAEMKKEEIVEDWKQKENQHVGIIQMLENMMKLQGTMPKKLMMLIPQGKINQLLEEMPFRSVFVSASQQEEEYSTFPEGLQKLCDFLRNLEALRKEMFEDYLKMIESSKEINPSDYANFGRGILVILSCDHNASKDVAVSHDDAARKSEKAKLECQVCIVRHTLSHLRYAIGAGNCNGQINEDSPKPIESILSFILEFGQKKMNIDGSKQIDDFKIYMDRIRRTSVRMQSSCDSIATVNNELRKLYFSMRREGELDVDNIKVYEKNAKLLKSKVNEAIRNLRFIINLYWKKPSNENLENVENDCIICYEQLVISVNLPCGHKVCSGCYQRWRNLNAPLICATCRQNFNHEEVIVAREEKVIIVQPKKAENQVDPSGSSGPSKPKKPEPPKLNLTAKMDETIKLMKEIIQKEPKSNNILLVTSAEYDGAIWKYLNNILQKAEMPFAPVVRDKKNSKLSTSKFSRGCKILLCSPSTCSNMFNVPEANHIIFLNQSLLFSALGKTILKNEQQRDIKLYHMITKGSIDETLQKIAAAGRNGDEEERNGIKLKVGELRKIFGVGR